jgi:hypothetical protein
VDIDETWCDYETGDVDHACGGLVDARCDPDNAVALDRDIATVPWAAGTVDDAAVAND